MSLSRLAGCIALVAALAGCRNVDVMTGSYPTREEARQAMDRGWIPNALPPGAHDIREAHDPDSNRRWGLFSFRAGDEDALTGLLDPGQVSLAGVTCDIPGRIEWWPVLLRGTLDAERIASAGLKAYRAKQSGLMWAVNWNQRRAYYWSQ